MSAVLLIRVPCNNINLHMSLDVLLESIFLFFSVEVAPRRLWTAPPMRPLLHFSHVLYPPLPSNPSPFHFPAFEWEKNYPLWWGSFNLPSLIIDYLCKIILINL
jgi:hypothetical protein